MNGTNIEVTFADGTRAEITNGRFELKDANNRTIVERSATPADRARLTSAVDQLGRDAIADISRSDPVKFEAVGRNLEVVYANGWKEEIHAGRYELKDAANRTVIERAATQADRDRIREALTR
ncbi:MAG: hypothetical protein D6754_09170 [Alphaproteobacteria bacterium]|nr:MAG: hypothetical protein D6754_09170 [Alphaproteobacteria bacterium]